MQDTPTNNDRVRDAAAPPSNRQPDMSRWAKRFLLPFLPLWVVIAVVVLAFLAIILWFALGL